MNTDWRHIADQLIEPAVKQAELMGEGEAWEAVELYRAACAQSLGRHEPLERVRAIAASFLAASDAGRADHIDTGEVLSRMCEVLYPRAPTQGARRAVPRPVAQQAERAEACLWHLREALACAIEAGGSRALTRIRFAVSSAKGLVRAASHREHLERTRQTRAE